MFCPRGARDGRGVEPGPGVPHDDQHPLRLVAGHAHLDALRGVVPQPCRIALARASRSAVSISNSLPFEHSMARASAMILLDGRRDRVEPAGHLDADPRVQVLGVEVAVRAAGGRSWGSGGKDNRKRAALPQRAGATRASKAGVDHSA